MRIIDADAVLLKYTGNILTAINDYAEGVRDVVEEIRNAPIIETKEIKYYDDDEHVWKIGRVIVDDV